MKINYILTAFSPAMFGEAATAHIKLIPLEEARQLVSSETRIMATRVSHERLARNQFPAANEDLARYANLKPGTNAIHLHYRGPMIADDGTLPVGGVVSAYLIEVEDYVAPE